MSDINLLVDQKGPLQLKEAGARQCNNGHSLSHKVKSRSSEEHFKSHPFCLLAYR